MIPKIIHYCWFGKGEKPEKMKYCIATWQEHLKDYVFMEWNEENFDVMSSVYVSQAYNHKKYAFVSDVARIQALEIYGGIYLDTDVEVYKAFDDILEHPCVLGLEYGNYVATSFLACEKGHPILQIFKKGYENQEFINEDGSFNTTTNVQRLTKILKDRGLKQENKLQYLGDIVVYPIEYFSPYDYVNCIMEKTENTYCAHLFLVSWMSKKEQLKKQIKTGLVKMIGKQNLIALRQLKDKEGKQHDR